MEVQNKYDQNTECEVHREEKHYLKSRKKKTQTTVENFNCIQKLALNSHTC